MSNRTPGEPFTFMIFQRPTNSFKGCEESCRSWKLGNCWYLGRRCRSKSVFAREVASALLLVSFGTCCCHSGQVCIERAPQRMF